jgi:GDP-L-fucose synthase
MGFYTNKRIVVTGGTGMIGRAAIDELIKRGAEPSNIRSVSLDELSDLPNGVHYLRADLTRPDVCKEVTENIDYVISMVGIKGSPRMTKEQPASFFVPTILFNTNLMEAAFRNKVKRFLYTSSVGVYFPATVFYEDSVWSTFPSENDKFAGWAKRMGELQTQAYRLQYGTDMFRIVRPTNIYGPYDNFDLINAMVIPSLIARVHRGENPLVVWGDGSQVRDFLYSEDCASGALDVFESDCLEPVNLGSGERITIKMIAEWIVKYSNSPLMSGRPSITWDTTKPSGDPIRVMDTTRAMRLGIEHKIGIEEGIKRTIEWYNANWQSPRGRYNVFRH